MTADDVIDYLKANGARFRNFCGTVREEDSRLCPICHYWLLKSGEHYGNAIFLLAAKEMGLESEEACALAYGADAPTYDVSPPLRARRAKVLRERLLKELCS